MTYIPNYSFPQSPVISTVSNESIGLMALTLNSTAILTSTAWPSANRAVYIPFSLRRSVQIYKMFTANGSSVGNSFDIGIYTEDGTKIISTGTTAQSGTTVIQVVTVTTTTIGPGKFYLAMACNGITGQYLSGTFNANATALLGVLTQNTAFNLPATASFATAATAYTPVFGFSTTPTL